MNPATNHAPMWTSVGHPPPNTGMSHPHRRTGRNARGPFGERGDDLDHAEESVSRPGKDPVLVGGWPAESWRVKDHNVRRFSHGSFSGSAPSREEMSELTLLRDVWDSLTRGHPLNVDRLGVFASEGTVTLTGRVKNQWDENLAVALTRNTRGVQHVDNQLRIPIRLKRTRML